ncbi:MAG: beta-galactosidase, partial [Verrucomicrobiae bacterium]|nr:beta-galactosidase [Verrucomicrobiae bacterium]
MPNASISPRQVHLDFHTSPHLRDVGVDFDAHEFARTLKRAHVTSVTVFAKCHHGHLYYNTRRPERHPGLKQGFDLLATQIEALHRENIRAPIYLSVQVDEYAANTHPEWVARNPD